MFCGMMAPRVHRYLTFPESDSGVLRKRMTLRLKRLPGVTMLVFVVAFIVAGPAAAQQAPVPLPQPSLVPAPSPSPSPSESVRPLYGVQGVLVETLAGKIVSSQNETEQFNPASTLKLATALVALKTLGPDHRFATAVWTDGQLDKTTGVLTGNLFVSGRDPSFHYEHAILIARELNTLGITQVNGDLVVAPGFTMNFSASASRSAEQLYDTLDSEGRPSPRADAARRAPSAQRSTICAFRCSMIWAMDDIRHRGV